MVGSVRAMTGDMPAAEVAIDADLVTRLVAEQFPDLAGERVEHLDTGWDNELFRVGDDHLARLPRRRIAVANIENELRWLPGLAADLPLPTSAPVGAGRPGSGYPWPWALCRALPGRTVLSVFDAGGDFADPEAEARRLADFLHALHRPAPADAPVSDVRGVPLRSRDRRMAEWFARIDRPAPEVDELRRQWGHALALPEHAGPLLWMQGDLHPGNVLTDGPGGAITGIIDFGDLNGGDPATDLMAGWMLFDRDARLAFRHALDVDDHRWDRGRGWAVTVGVAIAANSADNPPYARLGDRVLDTLLAGD